MLVAAYLFVALSAPRPVSGQNQSAQPTKKGVSAYSVTAEIDFPFVVGGMSSGPGETVFIYAGNSVFQKNCKSKTTTLVRKFQDEIASIDYSIAGGKLGVITTKGSLVVFECTDKYFKEASRQSQLMKPGRLMKIALLGSGTKIATYGDSDRSLRSYAQEASGTWKPEHTIPLPQWNVEVISGSDIDQNMVCLRIRGGSSITFSAIDIASEALILTKEVDNIAFGRNQTALMIPGSGISERWSFNHSNKVVVKSGSTRWYDFETVALSSRGQLQGIPKQILWDFRKETQMGDFRKKSHFVSFGPSSFACFSGDGDYCSVYAQEGFHAYFNDIPVQVDSDPREVYRGDGRSNKDVYSLGMVKSEGSIQDLFAKSPNVLERDQADLKWKESTPDTGSADEWSLANNKSIALQDFTGVSPKFSFNLLDQDGSVLYRSSNDWYESFNCLRISKDRKSLLVASERQFVLLDTNFFQEKAKANLRGHEGILGAGAICSEDLDFLTVIGIGKFRLTKDNLPLPKSTYGQQFYSSEGLHVFSTQSGKFLHRLPYSVFGVSVSGSAIASCTYPEHKSVGFSVPGAGDKASICVVSRSGKRSDFDFPVSGTQRPLWISPSDDGKSVILVFPSGVKELTVH